MSGQTQLPEIQTGTLGVTIALSVAHWREFKPEIDLKKCTKCWTCYTFCPEGAIDKTPEGPKVNFAFCKGCGVCANECPVKAISMVREE
ncbi:MAG: 4Fe-4S binding protein [Desulfurococcaceae archaeon]